MADAGVMTETQSIINTQAPEVAPIQTLKEKYSQLAQEYQELGRQQLIAGMDPNGAAWRKRQELDVLRQQGLFDSSLTEEQLKLKEQALQANQTPTSREQLAAEYQQLGKIQNERQLLVGEKARLDYLTDLAKRGELEAKNTNNSSKVAKAA